ncbi:MAG: metallophosphoesterase [Lachnospiraceae bacterium]|nr:metallophosphoesterase [Lachnospiraceae bacterium]
MKQTKTLFVVSDIHGHFSLLKDALDQAGFDPHNRNHLLICCGDYFNRGTENTKVLEYFETLPHKVLIRGNQDDVLLEIFETGEFRDYYYQNGIIETIHEWFGQDVLDTTGQQIDLSQHRTMVNRVKAFLEPTRSYFETKHFVFTHSWLPSNIDENFIQIRPNWRDADFSSWHLARLTKWISVYHKGNRLPDKTIVCGHVPTFFGSRIGLHRKANDASIFYGNGFIALDAGTFDTKQVNVLKIEDEFIC